MYAETPKQFNKTFRILIAHTEQEIDIIIHMGSFSGDKTGFVRLGHILPKQKQPGCKKSVRPIRSHNGYKRPKTLIGLVTWPPYI